MITLVKIDDRMIHGQVVIMWTKLREGERLIVVVDDTVYNDEFLRNSVKQAGNAVGKPTFVWSAQEAIEKLPKVIESDKKYFLICKTIKQMHALYDAGLWPGDEIDFGTASTRKEGAVKVWQNVNLSPEDIQLCEDLHQKGVRMLFRLIPAEKGVYYANEREKLLNGKE